MHFEIKLMSKRFLLLFCFFTLIFVFSCKKYRDNLSDVVINEIMPVNSSTAADQDGEYDDWIELYNQTASAVDLSGYYLSDNKKNPAKWQFPQGTSITGNGYLIIWTDSDSTQPGLHTNFKLSSTGEDAVLSKPDETIVDKTSFPSVSQTGESSYSRVPDGIGSFNWQTPTFNKSNGTK
jgi:hypothetical protein